MRRAGVVSSGVLFCLALVASAQQPADTTYSRRNTFGGFFEYSNDSSHIVLGDAENRKIGAIGFQYQRRLVHRRPLDFSFIAEARPGMIESDPVIVQTYHEVTPTPGALPGQPSAVVQCKSGSFPPYTYSGLGYTETGYFANTCSRRSVVEQGLSPAGLRVSLMSRRRLQLTFSTLGGYMFATQPVPIDDAGSFNFTFEFGGGLEYFTSRTRSIRLEYQVQHFSNKKTADLNPGVDSGFIKLTYAFGH